MDIQRMKELGGVHSAKKAATTVSEVLIENKTANVSDTTNRLRKMAGLPPITESVDIVEEACECTTEGCNCGGKKCDCGGECKCPNCGPKKSVTEGIEDQHAEVMGEYDDRGDTLSAEAKKRFHQLSAEFDKAHTADDDEGMADTLDAMKQLFS